MLLQPSGGLDFKAASPIDGAYIVELIAITAGLLLVAYLVLWLVRRIKMPSQNGARASGKLRVIDRIQVSPHTRISVVEYDQTRLLLAESNRHISLCERGPAGAKDD